MNPSPATPSTLRPEAAGHRIVVILSVLLVWRIGALIISPLNLGPDEAQYWRWGQSFDWGYYSKPPLIAWLIGTVTSVFGDTEWAVRLPAPILHTAIAGLISLTGYRMGGPRVGLYATLIYILMPGVTFSSGLMTTDSVLFVFWSAALLTAWRLREGAHSWQIAVMLGGLIGLGFLAKYAMIYFVLGLGLSALIDRPMRAALSPLRSALILSSALIVLGPHIFWNLSHDLQTLTHTVDNAKWTGPRLHPDHAVTFLVDQMGIFGPVSFLILLPGIGVLLTRKTGTELRQKEQAPDRWLLCFILPALVIILVQTVTSRAHANWAATAYIAASLLLARWMAGTLRPGRHLWIGAGLALMVASGFVPDLNIWARIGLGSFLGLGLITFGAGFGWHLRGALWAGLSLHLLTACLFTALAAGPPRWADELGLANAFKRARGWQASVARLAAIATEQSAQAILVDERENWHGLDYYGQSSLTQPVYAWRRYRSAKSYADLHPLADGFGAPVLIVNSRADFIPRIQADFARLDDLGTLIIDLGGGTERRFRLFLGHGYTPLARTSDWEARFSAQVHH